jgi:hypothetical protein
VSPAATTPKAPTDALAAFDGAFKDAVRATSDLRAAYQASADADRALAAAQRDDAEAARVAFVAGEDHKPDGRLAAAIEQRAAIRKRLDDLRADDDRRQAALAEAVQRVVDSGGKDALAGAIEQLIDAGEHRLELAVDELAAARRQLGNVLSLTTWLDDGGKPGGLREPAQLSRVGALRGPNGEAYSWPKVVEALHEMAGTARELLEAVRNRQPQREPRVSKIEMVQWHIAAGGSYSDSSGMIRSHYLEKGPRRDEAALDEQEAKTDMTRDQRTWGRA